tara:strand:- start:329 stop:646 length:318 start_codon:yes stop_codon:yes gene_type:complete
VSEKHLQDYLFVQAKKHGIYARKMQAVGHTGFPDVLLAFDGYALFIELKNPNGKGRLSQKQEAEIKRLMEAGLDVYVISKKEEVDDLIREIFEHEATNSYFAVIQ